MANLFRRTTISGGFEVVMWRDCTAPRQPVISISQQRQQRSQQAARQQRDANAVSALNIMQVFTSIAEGTPGNQSVKTIKFYTSGLVGTVNNVAGDFPIAFTRKARLKTGVLSRFSERVFGVKRVAGSGKSAIAHTINIPQKFKQEGRRACRVANNEGTLRFYVCEKLLSGRLTELCVPSLKRLAQNGDLSLSEIADAETHWPSTAFNSLQRSLKDVLSRKSTAQTVWLPVLWSGSMLHRISPKYVLRTVTFLRPKLLARICSGRLKEFQSRPAKALDRTNGLETPADFGISCAYQATVMLQGQQFPAPLARSGNYYSIRNELAMSTAKLAKTIWGLPRSPSRDRQKRAYAMHERMVTGRQWVEMKEKEREKVESRFTATPQTTASTDQHQDGVQTKASVQQWVVVWCLWKGLGRLRTLHAMQRHLTRGIQLECIKRRKGECLTLPIRGWKGVVTFGLHYPPRYPACPTDPPVATYAI
ncbi:hypothetical protein FIBSPDRAFT_886105 [Athelia psychrophila]|uniref:Uncharacterized protein n=1 Tax=Athelia psychrophila TaxID=1759441 RepID=A0A166R3V5_9AGAM|nr:hypothetical protein FIBSPDRAFT_886105 [Fibularhizoctonia sp. CBS 109695]